MSLRRNAAGREPVRPVVRTELFGGLLVMTTFHMELVSSDESREPVDGHHDDLDAACRKAFQIASEAARPGWRSGAAKPVRVNVYRGDVFELSIEVAHDRGGSAARG